MEIIRTERAASHERGWRGRLTGWWGQWPRWSIYGAIAWSVLYSVLGAAWSLGAPNYPFALVDDDRSSASILEGAPVEVVGPVLVLLGILGVIAGVIMLRNVTTPWVRWFSLVVGGVLAVSAACLVPDYTILAIVAMWPALLVFAFTGVPGDQAGLGDILYWHRVNLIMVFLGGLLWAGATLGTSRRRRNSCQNCGRSPHAHGVAAPQLRTWGRRFVWLAVLATVPYDLTRLAWFLGWPLGLSDAMFDNLRHPPFLLTLGLLLALLSTGGAALTHGLVARWGEVFPRWVWFAAGRRVPPRLAVIPAGIVAVTLPPATIMFMNSRVNGGFSLADWGTWAPSLVWIFWAVGLAGATYCYYLRRRSQCRHCRQGEERSINTAAVPSAAT